MDVFSNSDGVEKRQLLDRAIDERDVGVRPRAQMETIASHYRAVLEELLVKRPREGRLHLESVRLIQIARQENAGR